MPRLGHRSRHARSCRTTSSQSPMVSAKYEGKRPGTGVQLSTGLPGYVDKFPRTNIVAWRSYARRKPCAPAWQRVEIQSGRFGGFVQEIIP